MEYLQEVHKDCKLVEVCVIAIGPKTGTVFPIKTGGKEFNAFRYRCMSEAAFYKQKNLKLDYKNLPKVITATGANMQPLDNTHITFTLGDKTFTQRFLVCR